MQWSHCACRGWSCWSSSCLYSTGLLNISGWRNGAKNDCVDRIQQILDVMELSSWNGVIVISSVQQNVNMRFHLLSHTDIRPTPPTSPWRSSSLLKWSPTRSSFPKSIITSKYSYNYFWMFVTEHTGEGVKSGKRLKCEKMCDIHS